MNRQVIFRIGLCCPFFSLAVGVLRQRSNGNYPAGRAAATEPFPAGQPGTDQCTQSPRSRTCRVPESPHGWRHQDITNISGGSGGVDLQMIEEDYLATATSIPLMGTVDEIYAARSNMGDLTGQFSEETKAQMQIFNGSTEDMRSSINDSIASVGESVDGVKGYAWRPANAARLQVFDLAVMKQNELLASLSSRGIDVSAAQSVADQIAAQRTVLVDALKNHDDAALTTTNAVIKSLNQQFRNDIATYRAKLEIQMTVAALNL